MDEAIVSDTAPDPLDEAVPFEYTLNTELLSFVPVGMSVGGVGIYQNKILSADFECSHDDFMSHTSGSLTADIITPYAENVTINITANTDPVSSLWDLSVDCGCYIRFYDNNGNEAYVWQPIGADESVILDTAPGSGDEASPFEYTLNTELLSFVPVGMSVGGVGIYQNKILSADFECSHDDFMSHASGSLTADIINPYAENVTINITVSTEP